MWIATQKGFVQAVASKDDAEKMLLRAYDEQDLYAILASATYPKGESLPEIQQTPGGNYPFRAILSRKALVPSW